MRLVLVAPVLLISMLAGCQQPPEPMAPVPWAVEPTETTLPVSAWVAKAYTYDHQHIVSVTTNVSSGPALKLITIVEEDYAAFKEGAEYAPIRSCSHDRMANSTFSCVLEPGTYQIILLNPAAPDQSRDPPQDQASEFIYSIGGAYVADDPSWGT